MKRSDGDPDHVPTRTAEAVARLLGGGVGRRWVAAVSGGSDSVGMLLALVATNALELIVAHLDHGARGEESKGDALFVERLAGDLGLPFVLGRWESTRSSHFEADARAARHAWLADVGRERNANAVALGHTRDDQAETILHRILRGTGPDGLRGIPKRRRLAPGLDLVRPVLELGRADLVDWLAARGQTFRVDASNGDLSRTRNRIRRDLLPKLAAEYNPDVAGALIRLAALIEPAAKAERRAAARIEARALESQSAGRRVYDLAKLKAASLDERAAIFRRAWGRLGLSERAMTFRHWTRLAEAVDGERGRINLPGDVFAGVEGDRFVLRVRSRRREESSPIAVELPGATEGFGGRLVVSIEANSAATESVDFDAIAPPLRLDRPRPGDRFDPLGMDGRTTPLADFLRGRGLKKDERDAVLLLRDREGIVWVVGHRIAHRVRLVATTERRLGLSWTGEPGEASEAGSSGCD